MARETDTDMMLDALFAEARQDMPDDALMARVLADASAVQDAARAAPPVTAPRPERGWLAGMVAAIGGWGALSGVSAAGVMGLAVGLYSPDAVANWVGSDTIGLESSYEFTPDLSALWVEDGDV